MKEETKKEYEISYLLNNPEIESEVLSILKKNGVEITNQKSATSIVLAYPIQKHLSAYFGFCHFNAEPAAIEPIDATLRLHKGLIRFLIITPPVKLAAPGPMSGIGRPERSERLEKKVAAPGALSNEALSEKLEEILK